MGKIRDLDIKDFGSKAAIIIVSFVTFSHYIVAAFKTMPVDFYAFYTGATILITDKSNLYNPEVQQNIQEQLFKKGFGGEKGYMAFVNLPVSAIPYFPFLLIPPLVAEKVAQALTLVAILWTIYRLYKFHKLKFLSWTTAFVASFYPIYATVHLGQIGTFIFWVATEMYIAFMERKTLKLGVLSSLLFLKFQYLPFILLIFAIYPERKKFIKISAFCIFLFALANYLLMGNELLLQYFSLIGQYVTKPGSFGMEYKFGMDIYSLLSVLVGGFKNSLTSVAVIGTLALSTQAALFIFLLKKRDSYTQGSDIFYFCLITALIMTPHSMPADFIILAIPLIGLLPRIKKAWFYTATVIILSLFFYFSAFGWQWTHTILLLLYLPLLVLSAIKNPGSIGQKIHGAVEREKSFLVGDPGIEPGTARV
ncbi:MAG: hypothetical protein UU64_C0004G0003 [candidate division WWE3 bacterium GW2011_GWF2_41_45]|nr:MAG: hypothetical protein UU64_C0004G0003 [candidate division WWE3 bacterium GW2011_GWF2_41_45]KKS12034.1 MAG: hypothetical protein UU68_C0006G0003 [candidate division WWE3 bacterium GW2011_GWF1_41_53]KKS20056.1 MAG: hypothetical protein UU79_C0004G0003 [candidate division WWE3 bacterium GW2011_GWE1_41_72]KKS50668.1 MAG: hypothetical protein UV16_C0007G0036 [candidate division WWE3 bacterium GW2011_GWE2_42_25]